MHMIRSVEDCVFDSTTVPLFFFVFPGINPLSYICTILCTVKPVVDSLDHVYIPIVILDVSYPCGIVGFNGKYHVINR